MLHRWRQLQQAWSQRTATWTFSGTVACLGIAFVAQRNLDQHKAEALPLAILGLAALAFALLLCNIGLEAANEASENKPSTISLPAVAIILAVSLLGCLDFGGNRFRPLGLVLWIGGLWLTLVYLWLISPDSAFAERIKQWQQQKFLISAHGLGLAVITFVGAWFRLRLISEIPAEMGFDLAEKYFDALSIARGSYYIFFPARLGREGLFFYLVALVGRFIGLRKLTLHVTSASVGILTIVAVYFLGKETFKRKVGLLAAFLLAVNRWHIVLSRSGFRVATMPLFTTLALYAFIRAMRRRKPLDFGWAGVALGAGIYSYRSFLFVPIALAAGLALWLLTASWSEFRTLLPGLVVVALIAAVIAAPLVRYALENPDKYLARERYQLRAIAAQKERSQGLLAYYWRCMLGFNYMGDGDPRFNVPFARMMGFVSGTLMALGLAYLLLRWHHGANAFMLVAWFVLILPAAWSMLPDEYPSSLRMSGALGPAVILAALPIPLIGERLRETKKAARVSLVSPEIKPPESIWSISLTWRAGPREHVWTWHWRWDATVRYLLAVTVILLCAYEAAEVHRFYFQEYILRLPDMSNYSLAKAIAAEIQHYSDLSSTYIKPWPNWFDSTVLQLHVGTDRSWDPFVKVLAPDQPPLATVRETAMFILHPADDVALATLQTFFPRTVVIPHYYPNGEPAFDVVYCER